MAKFALICSILLVGCASLQERMNEQVKIGEDFHEVESDMGDPSKFISGPDGMQMVYIDRVSVCTVMLDGGHVIGSGCVPNRGEDVPESTATKVIKAFGAILQGAGQGLMHAQDNSYSCTDYGGGHFQCWNRGRMYNCDMIGNTVTCR